MTEAVMEVRRFVEEHLTVAMIMVPLADPLDPEERTGTAYDYLEANGYDLALVKGPEVRLIYRKELAELPKAERAKPVSMYARPPQTTRLVERTLELREAARLLHKDSCPLLVVGKHGPEHIVSRADFTRTAGRAAVLSLVLALDAQLEELLRPYEDEACKCLPPNRQREISDRAARATKASEEVHKLAYLPMGDRIGLLFKLGVNKEAGIDTSQDLYRMVSVRNRLAHSNGEMLDALDTISVFEVADILLDKITTALATRSAMTGSS